MKNHGVTLLEMMIALTISFIAIAATLALVGSAGALARNADIVSESNNYARLGGDAVAATVRNAGMGGGQGVYVNVGGTPQLLNPFFGADNLATNQAGVNVNRSDDLWIVVPDKNAMRDSCNNKGAYVSVIAAGLGALSVVPFPGAPCAPPFANNDTLLVTNMNRSALITRVQLGVTSIDYAESAVPGFSNAPERGGYQIGDMIYRASIIHLYLDRDPITNRLALFRSNGSVGADFLGRPFVDIAGTATLVQNYVEDFQVVYWIDPNLTNDPSQYVIQHGLNPAYQAGVRSVTINLVATTSKQLLDGNNGVILSSGTTPKNVANHILAAPAPDGLRRGIYSRRIEIPNLISSNI